MIPNLGRFADNYPSSVIDKKPAADGRAGMNFDTGHKAAYLRKHSGNERDLEIIQDMNNAMKKYRVKTGIKKKFNIS